MNPREEMFTFTEKWTDEIKEYNFTQVPKLLIYCQGHLKLTDGELVTLIQLISHWYTTERDVFPGIKRLAAFSGKDYNTIQRRLMLLEEKCFLERIHRTGTSNIYDLAPTVTKLLHHIERCPTPPNKQGEYTQNVGKPLSLIASNKEYEARKIQKKKTSRAKDPTSYFFKDDIGSIL